MKEQIAALLQKVRPMLQADGGDVEFVDFDESTGTVKVKLQGACGSCPMATMTLKHGIEKYLKEACPAVKAVERV
ncbi:MAG: NifU family protein [Elusimicrobiota bacterium]|jgi:Fe-S cluster biogenesis protein NfuA|nr:NifU family protein [Elusimicrobiota bacterium]MDR1123999.1 NifU family protein [Elusimicrobiota bacterium]